MAYSTGLCDRGSFPRPFGEHSQTRSSTIRGTLPPDSSTIRGTYTSSRRTSSRRTSSRSDDPVDKLAEEKRPSRKVKTKTFLIGKELKTKDLRHTAVDRGKRIVNKTQPKTRIKTPGEQDRAWRGLLQRDHPLPDPDRPEYPARDEVIAARTRPAPRRIVPVVPNKVSVWNSGIIFSPPGWAQPSACWRPSSGSGTCSAW